MHDFIAPDLAKLFAASEHVSLFVWEHSEGWPVMHCTDNVSRLLGYSKDDFYQRRVNFIDTIHPDDTQRVSEEVLAGIASGDNSFTHEDYRLVSQDGREVWVSDTTLVERDAQGEVRYLIGYMLDITARKHLELALMAERKHLQMVLEGTRLGSWDWNPLRDELAVNQRWCSMYGLDSHQPVSLRLWESLVHPEDRHEWRRALHMHLTASTPFYEHVYRMRHARGHYLHVLDRGKVVEWDDRHRALRFSGTHTDISKQKKAELEAREAARSRALFLANMSHEIRTPLHGVLGLASVLQSTQLDTHQQQLLTTMQESGEYLLNTLNDAIDISRADQGKLTIRVKPQPIQSLVTHLQSLFEEQAKRRGIDYRVLCDVSVPDWLELDKSRVLQIAVNLVNNAFKFTKAGFIQLRIAWYDERLHMQVKDSGVGIEDTEKVWQIFEQESEESMYPKPGGGLGLGIVRSLVELMGGEASVSSVLGQGSCFAIEIPAKQAQAQTQHIERVQTLPVLKILVIDDNDINQLILGEMLSNLGQVYVSASSARMGIELLRNDAIDVVFMDIHMPDMDGVEATQLVREEALQQPYIIGLTANALPAMRRRAFEAGMNAYLTKPFQIEHIRSALQAALE